MYCLSVIEDCKSSECDTCSHQIRIQCDILMWNQNWLYGRTSSLRVDVAALGQMLLFIFSECGRVAWFCWLSLCIFFFSDFVFFIGLEMQPKPLPFVLIPVFLMRRVCSFTPYSSVPLSQSCALLHVQPCRTMSKNKACAPTPVSGFNHWLFFLIHLVVFPRMQPKAVVKQASFEWELREVSLSFIARRPRCWRFHWLRWMNLIWFPFLERRWPPAAALRLSSLRSVSPAFCSPNPTTGKRTSWRRLASSAASSIL